MNIGQTVFNLNLTLKCHRPWALGIPRKANRASGLSLPAHILAFCEIFAQPAHVVDIALSVDNVCVWWVLGVGCWGWCVPAATAIDTISQGDKAGWVGFGLALTKRHSQWVNISECVCDTHTQQQQHTHMQLICTLGSKAYQKHANATVCLSIVHSPLSFQAASSQQALSFAPCVVREKPQHLQMKTTHLYYPAPCPLWIHSVFAVWEGFSFVFPRFFSRGTWAHILFFIFVSGFKSKLGQNLSQDWEQLDEGERAGKG